MEKYQGYCLKFGPITAYKRSHRLAWGKRHFPGGEHLAEPALWVSSWRHQGQLQATLDARTVLVSTDQLFKVPPGCIGVILLPSKLGIHQQDSPTKMAEYWIEWDIN